MLPEVVRALECPVCRGPLAAAGSALACPAGHSFDIARQGYANLLTGRASGVGDSAAMVAARARFLGAGHMAPLAAAVAARAASGAAPEGLLIEVGAGTAYYLAAALDRMPGRRGLAIDLSVPAARRAARAHERLSAIVADARGRLPVSAGAAALVLDVFAPRAPGEIARLLAPGGALLVVTPGPGHLAELREPLGLIDVDPDKERRLEAALGARFERAERDALTFPLDLDSDDAAALVAMGPSAHHVAPAELAARVAALPRPIRATAEVRIDLYRPRAQPLSGP